MCKSQISRMVLCRLAMQRVIHGMRTDPTCMIGHVACSILSYHISNSMMILHGAVQHNLSVCVRDWWLFEDGVTAERKTFL